MWNGSGPQWSTYASGSTGLTHPVILPFVRESHIICCDSFTFHMDLRMLFPRPMDETRLAEEFLGRMQAGEFDGRLYETIAKLSDDELRQIVGLTAKEPGVSGG